MTQNITAKECRFAVYVPPREQGQPDMHLIKEHVHYADGTQKPNISLVYDYKRPFYTTKKGQRNHKQAKEWENIVNLNEGKCTQTNLLRSVANALAWPSFKGSMKMLATKEPYIYGTDILSTAIIKKSYQDRYPDVQTKYTIAVFDTETDVVNGTNEIIMATVTFKNKVFTAVVKSFVEGISDVENRVNQKMHEYLGEYVESRKLESTLVFVDNALEAVRATMDFAHREKPDFLAIWNMDFDITKVLNACEKYGANPADIFSDPMVPKEYRYFDYKRGPKQKVTASGKITPIKPAAQWHTVIAPASFYIIDAMCVYKHTRIGSPEEQSYSLDNILNKHLGIRKLKFKEAEDYQGLKWHIFMQQSYKIEYIIYNRFDCISMEVLDEKTNDMSLTLPLFSGCSDFENFKSQPRRTVDNLHWFCLKRGKMISASTKEFVDEDDYAESLGLEGWITALPAHLVLNNGLHVISENPEAVTNFRSATADLDVSAS